jgi:hypothetical protein
VAIAAAEADADLDYAATSPPPGRQEPTSGRRADVTLRPADVRAPVVIAVWDSGTDTRVFAEQMVREAGQPALIAFDRYSRPRERRPRAAASRACRARRRRIAARSKGFFRPALERRQQGGRRDQGAALGLTAEQFRSTSEELAFGVQSYTHGTHVAGIALAGNPGARAVVAPHRVRLHPEAPIPARAGRQYEREAQAAQAYVDFIAAAQGPVANMSWGGDVGDIESDLEQCGIGKTAPSATRSPASTSRSRRPA